MSSPGSAIGIIEEFRNGVVCRASKSATVLPEQNAEQMRGQEASKARSNTDKISVTQQMLSNPDLEDEPLKLLRTSEAFWKV